MKTRIPRKKKKKYKNYLSERFGLNRDMIKCIFRPLAASITIEKEQDDG